MTDKSKLLQECISHIFGRSDSTLAISTGTPGPFRKITAMILNSDGKISGYAKIGETPLAIQRIKHEAKILKLIADSSWVKGHSSWVIGDSNSRRVHIPESLYEGEIGDAYVLIQSPSPFEGKSGSSDFTEDYAQVLSAMISKTAIKKKFDESEFYKTLKENIYQYPVSFRNLMVKGFHKLEENLRDEEITLALSHGDFAPWNMLWKNKDVFLFDWEFANVKSPAGLDVVDFLFKIRVLLQKDVGKVKLFLESINHFYQSHLSDMHNNLLSSKAVFLCYLLHKSVEEDKYYLTERHSAARRHFISLLTDL